jgi:exonuclease III
MNSKPTITILQYNLHKCQARTDSILNHPDSEKYTLLLLQEYYWSPYTKKNPQHPSWTTIEPPATAGEQPHVIIYINKKRLATASFAQVNLPFKDTVIVTIKTNETNKPTLIINIYNPGDSSLIRPLRKYLRTNIRKENYHAIIIAGDFNLHHPMWNPPDHEQHDQHDKEMDELIELMMSYGLKQLLSRGTITYPNGGITIDLVWGNTIVEEGIIKCQIAEHEDHSLDHEPIETILDLDPQIPESNIQPPFNYEKMDIKTFKTKILEYLPNLLDPEFATPETVDQYTEEITTGMIKTIEETIPRRRSSPFSKR